MFVAIIDWIKSLVEKVKDRIQNPFGDDTSTAFAGAFVVAFTVKHWRMVYSLLYFDEDEKRLSRLQILEEYLKNENYKTLLVYPALYAIAALALYYIVNNITLAISLLLRDYLKGGILLFFDRRRIRTKEEFDRIWRQLNRSQTNYQKANDEIRALQSELDETSRQLSELNVLHASTTDKLNSTEQGRLSLEREVGLLRSSDSSDSTFEGVQTFKLVSAKFGWNESFVDVTELVEQALLKTAKFNVENGVLGGDPLRYTIKDLEIVYLSKNRRHEVAAIEGSIVEQVADELTIHETSISEQKMRSRNSMLALAKDFEGQWTLQYTLIKNGESRKESVVVDNKGRYFANGKYTFDIRGVSFDSTTGKASFAKIDMGHKLFSKESLSRDTKDTWTGTDSKGYKMEYSKVYN